LYNGKLKNIKLYLINTNARLNNLIVNSNLPKYIATFASELASILNNTYGNVVFFHESLNKLLWRRYDNNQAM
jgi:hypothetical protein